MLICENIESISTDEWKALRTKGIGGSDAPMIMGVGFKTILDVYWNKTGELPVNEKSSITLDIGHLLEPRVLREFEIRNPGWKVYLDRRMITSDKYPFMLADIDGYTIDPRNGDKYILEAKTTSERGLSEWGGPTDDKIPLKYKWQGRHYNVVHDDAVGVIFVCQGGNMESGYRQRVMLRDRDEENLLIEKERDFWNCVLTRTLPEVVFGEKELDALKSHYKPRKERINIHSEDITEYDSILAEMAELKLKLKKLEAKKNEIEGGFLSFLQGKEAFIFDKDIRYLVVQGKRRSCTIPSEKLPALKLAFPEAFIKFAITKETLTPKFIKCKERGEE